MHHAAAAHMSSHNAAHIPQLIAPDNHAVAYSPNMQTDIIQTAIPHQPLLQVQNLNTLAGHPTGTHMVDQGVYILIAGTAAPVQSLAQPDNERATTEQPGIQRTPNIPGMISTLPQVYR